MAVPADVSFINLLFFMKQIKKEGSFSRKNSERITTAFLLLQLSSFMTLKFKVLFSVIDLKSMYLFFTIFDAHIMFASAHCVHRFSILTVPFISHHHGKHYTHQNLPLSNKEYEIF
jgi:hypothetical protein